ncbi:hypothetical protein [Thermospira aquatica]|uniref:LPP20 lipoprotein n=1 Tax=Thermospira aquatica TaxID=2828656 RepID=A0AAX3BC80_9SPIR|nr:hypothetical protein [Thermospira aquatica]URA09877.1 hypothetical protein KDW03_10385 [Thermospira aquatica]
MPKVVERSAAEKPAWIITPKKDAKNVYFVGIAEKQASLQAAKKMAVSDATKQLIDYIGIRVTRKLSYKATGTESDNASLFEQQVQESIEGKGKADISVDVEDVYYERYDDGTYTMYTLLKISKSWIEKEREKQQKLVASQRITSQKYLSDAKTLMSQRYYQPALEALWQGLLISGKAAENEDVYEEIRTTLLSLYQRLSLQLVSSPVYAYLEGGSDPIVVQLTDTEKNSPLSGIPLEAVSSRASLVSKGGTTTDARGKMTYEVQSVNASDNISVTITFSFKTYSNIIALDSELEEQLEAVKNKNRIELSLKVSPRFKAQSTTVILLKKVKEGRGTASYNLVQADNAALSAQLSQKGFHVVEIELPEIDFDAEKKAKETLLAYLRASFPQIQRLLYVTLDVNLLGNAGDLVNIDALASMYVADASVSYDWIEIKTGKIEQGKPFKSKGAGLNGEQAIQNATKQAITTLVNTLDESAKGQK